jgi:DNA-binding HxlR family transcriptional regulator
MTKVIRDERYSIIIMDVEHALGLIRYISEHGEAMAYELRTIIPTYHRMKRTMEDLRDCGLVTIEHIERPRITYKYRLTKKGEAVAAKLREIDEIINS